MQEVEAEAVEPEDTSAIEHRRVIAEIRRAAAMPDDHAAQVRALRRENLQLLAAHRAVLGMRRDRRAGRLMRARRRPQAHLLILRDLPLAGRALDDARLDAGVADPLVDLTDIHGRDIVDRPLLEV